MPAYQLMANKRANGRKCLTALALPVVRRSVRRSIGSRAGPVGRGFRTNKKPRRNDEAFRFTGAEVGLERAS
jgi:hypothetical protein